MAPNALTRNAGLRLGPIFLETLFKHYIEQDEDAVPLRKDELLYDEVFNIVRSFLSQASAKHTVEELQAFSNTRTPSTPANHVVRVTIPMSSCDSAAEHLISAFGGEENMKRTVGGTKWWQVRGIRGVSAEWMCSKKDQQEAKRKAREAAGGRKPTTGFNFFNTGSSTDAGPSLPSDVSDDIEDVYRAEMDNLKCILYFHGGGYYFGSIDQERYTMQRMARKIHGRLLAVNYRLAPQYPFPCAIQDILAAYLYLINPPEGALHRAVSPSDIVVCGDSAGGGLTAALLQVIRDAGLPLPAGGILVSPWCDLTHSFPSIYQNTTTDVIPATGLSLHKPSSLWPPPPDGVNARVRDGLRASVRAAFHRHGRKGSGINVDTNIAQERQAPPHRSESMVELPPLSAGGTGDQTVTIDDPNDPSKPKIEIHSQLQLYCPNALVRHPLVSAALSYLGGLCPLLVIVSDREVLRDEGIYTAHRAADPAKFPIKQEVVDVYPRFKDLAPENMVPTPVHLQVYDDAAHVLPVLFPFTTPAKYCFRAMATFCNQVYSTDPRQRPSTSSDSIPPDITILQDEPVVASPTSETAPKFPSQPPTPMTAVSSATQPSDSEVERLERAKSLDASNADVRPLRERMSRLSLSSSLASLRRRSRSPHPKSPREPQLPSSPTANGPPFSPIATVTPTQANQPTPPTLPLAVPRKEPSEDVAGPRHKHSAPHAPSDVLAGNNIVYTQSNPPWPNPPAPMIRERISTSGVVRPLEPQSTLSAFTVPEEQVGVVPEAALVRYMDGKAKMDAKYKREIKRIGKKRMRVAKEVPESSAAHLARLQHYLERQSQEGEVKKGKGRKSDGKADGEGGALNAAILGANWSLAWALDSDEHPPPSSIVARRDTREARALALVADQAVIAEPSRLNANSLWASVLGMFTVDASRKSGENKRPSRDDTDGPQNGEAREKNKEEGKEGKNGRRKKRESIVGHHALAGGEPKSKRRAGLSFWRLRASGKKHEPEARQEITAQV
ncbi:unnamed protein product [Peniophora sp. CBMAI 1063]|nr:unnamed protein product [Peniophora sp. CBMAI 1063]